LQHKGLPEAIIRRLGPLLKRWGQARLSQILSLWTFLGDGCTRPISTSSLQVWGSAGTGKSAVVSNFLSALQIRHIWLSCACFTSVGELHARIVELLRREALRVLQEHNVKPPACLLRRSNVGRQLRALDRFEAALKLPLQWLAHGNATEDGSSGHCANANKVVIVLDHAQELARLGPDVMELIINLPEVLQLGCRIAIVTISRLPLSRVGLSPMREPPSICFQAYSESEATEALMQTFTTDAPGLPTAELQSLCGSGLLKFAAPYLGCDLHQLLQTGREVICASKLQEAAPKQDAHRDFSAMKKHLDQAVKRRIGLCDFMNSKSDSTLPGYLGTDADELVVGLSRITQAEKRLIVAAYLGGHVGKENDAHLFVDRHKRHRRVTKKKTCYDLPVHVCAPQPTSLMRMLAIYHRLARQTQLLGPHLFEHLASLRDAGLLHFAGNICTQDHDVKVTCRAELPMVRACAAHLNVDLAEYLCR